MTDSDDDFSDLDDDLIALTLKPPRFESSQVPKEQHDPKMNNAELQAAKGEIAILRSKLLEIEKLNKQEKDQQLESHQNATDALESKVNALESTVRRLQDERKFLSVEVKNLSSRKKRKTSDIGIEQLERERNETPPITPVTTAPTTASSITTTITTNNAAPIKFIPQLVDDNVMFIDNLIKHTITGLENTTIEYLYKISLTKNFEIENLTIPKDEPISNYLVKFLNSYKDILRLDQLINAFSQVLISIIKTILSEFNNDRFYLPIPFLLSLLHNCLIFRPSAISKELTTSIISFNLEIMNKFDSILKPKEMIGELYGRHSKIKINVIQFEIIKKLSFLFSFEIIEILLINLNQFNDFKFNQKLISRFESQFNYLFKLILSSNSCINLVFIMVNILNCLLNSFSELELNKFPLLNQTVLDQLLKILNNGIGIKTNWFFTGLNKIIGNTQDNKLIPELIDWDLKLNKFPKVIYPIENYNTFKNLNDMEFELTNLNFQILVILEKLILFYSHKENELILKDSNFLKSIVLSISKQQQLNIIRPKSNLSYLRSKFISKLIRILNLYWESTMSLEKNEESENNEPQEDLTMTPLLPKEVTQMLMITLSRIAFSNNETSHESIKFLLKIRSIKNLKKVPVFNKFSELKSREISHSNNEILNLQELVDCEIGVSNGVEFAYDDDVVELARDMLEKFTTMNEADSLFSAMNAEG